jgi:hypothetical protein
VNYKEKVIDILKSNLTERAFNLWDGIQSRLPNTFDLLTSSTGKYHKKLNGEVPTQGEHVYQMLYGASKIMRMFGVELKSPKSDAILMAIALHDSVKYGLNGARKFTDNTHDKNMADIIQQNKETFLKLFSEEEFNVLEEAVRFHSGRWSTDVSKNKPFTFSDYNPETMLVHLLDMLSTADALQTDVRENDNSNNRQDSNRGDSTLVSQVRSGIGVEQVSSSPAN